MGAEVVLEERAAGLLAGEGAAGELLWHPQVREDISV